MSNNSSLSSFKSRTFYSEYSSLTRGALYTHRHRHHRGLTRVRTLGHHNKKVFECRYCHLTYFHHSGRWKHELRNHHSKVKTKLRDVMIWSYFKLKGDVPLPYFYVRMMYSDMEKKVSEEDIVEQYLVYVNNNGRK